eukprot:s1350_g10.t2
MPGTRCAAMRQKKGSASCLASTGASELSTRLLEWMLQRPPQLAGSIEHDGTALCVESRNGVPTAAGNSRLRHCSGAAAAIGPDRGPREPTPPAKRGSQSSATTSDGPCHGRRCCSALRSAAQILPSLCTAAQVQENLFFMRMVIAILHAVLPRTHGDAHPAISLWRDYWDVMVF